MQLYLVRHAIAELRENWDRPDEERPLTAKGRKRMSRLARGFAEINAPLTHLYSSPLVRALQTAEILQKRLKIGKIEQTDLIVPAADPAKIMTFLNEHDNEAVIALVGHEPHLGSLLTFLLTGKSGSFASLKKGGMASLSAEKPFKAGGFSLHWLLEPKHLIALAGK